MENTKLMEQAQQLVEENPDSALTLLRSVNTGLLDDATYYNYVLLEVQAKDKEDLDISNHTEVFRAYDYFRTKENHKNTAWTALYAGSVCQARKENKKALHYLLEAEKASDAVSGDDHFKGLIQSRIGELFYNRYMPDTAIMHYRKAAECYRKAGHIVNEIFSYNSIGSAFKLKEMFDSALYYCNRAIDILPDSQVWLHRVFIQNKAFILQEQGEPIQAKNIFVQILKQAETELDKIRPYLGLSMVYLDLGLIDSAFFYAHKVAALNDLPDDLSVAVYKQLSLVEESRGDLVQALHYSKLHNALTEAVFEKQEEETLAEIRENYHYEQMRNENNRLVISRQRTGLVFLIVLSVCLGGVLALIIRIVRVQKRAAGLTREMKTLRDETQQYRQQAQQIRENMIREQEKVTYLEQEKISIQANEKKRILELREEQEMIRRNMAEDSMQEIDRLQQEIKKEQESAGRRLHETDVLYQKTRTAVDTFEQNLRHSSSETLKRQIQMVAKAEKMKKNLDMQKDRKRIEELNHMAYLGEPKPLWELLVTLLPGNFCDRLQQKFPELELIEIQICVLSYFEHDIHEIIKITGVSAKTVYNHNTEIRKKLGIEPKGNIVNFLIDYVKHHIDLFAG